MSRFLIIEGVDESGKTTLAKSIASTRNTVYFHSTASQALFPALMDYHQNILNNVKTNLAMGKNVVLDRFWPSEYCYGLNLLRTHSGYNPAEFIKQVKELGGLYVFCFSRNGWSRYKEGHTDPAHSLTEEQYRRVYANYRECQKQLNITQDGCAASYLLEDDGIVKADFNKYINIVTYGFDSTK